MPGLAQRNEHLTNGSSTPTCSLSANGFWSKNSDDVSYNQLQKFWSELSLQARQKLLRIDKQSLFEQARKNMYCSRCNGLLLEGFLQIAMYGKSLQQEGLDAHFPCNRSGGLRKLNNDRSSIINGCQDEIQDPSIHPWGGLTTARDGSLTLMSCYLYSKSLKGLQIVFDEARARERERELLYPDACGGGGRGWISQGIVSYGRGHGTRETCALHTARLSCDTLVDFWSALGDEMRLSLLRMKEEDFIERLMYRFDSKRFCRDCRRNVIREYKELKELKRIRREPRCTSWFCVADSAFQYEVSDDSVQADWRQTFADAAGTYHHFEWAVGTTEGKSDILEFENVGLNGCVRASGLDLGGLSACFVTLRAWRLDGRCTELSVKAHSLKGQQCVHCRLIVGDGYVTITKGESIRRFFEHAEEAEEEEDDDSVDKDGNELDGECSRPQKHAKSPELAREFLLDAATVIFKEQVEKAFREGTARQNAHSIFVCLALKLLEDRVHVACKEIITLEKQMKLLEEEEKEKREEEERKERRRTKEREKKLRRKERLKGKEKEKKCSESNDALGSPEISKEELSAVADMEQNNPISCRSLVIEANETNLLGDDSPNIEDEEFSSECNTLKPHDLSHDDCGEEISNTKDEMGQSTIEQSMLSHRRLRCRKEFQLDMPMKWSDRRRYAVVSENSVMVGRSEPRHYGESFVISSRVMNGLSRQSRINVPTKSNCRNVGPPKYNEKFYSSKNRTNDRCDIHSCSCSLNSEYKTRVEQHSPMTRVSRETKPISQSESAGDTSKQFCRGNKNNQVDYMHESNGRAKSKIISGNYPSRDLFQSKKVWEPTESQKKYLRSNSDSDVILRATKVQGAQSDLIKLSIGEAVDSGENDDEECNSKRFSGVDERCQDDFHVEAKGSCSSTEIALEESGICPTGGFALNNSSDSTQSSTFSSDNCSSCLSEGDNNTTSSSHENTESSITSDSEDASRQSELRNNLDCVETVLSHCHDVSIVNSQNANGEGLTRNPSSLISSSLDGTRNYALGNPIVETAQNFDNCFSTTNVCSQSQSMLPPVSNQNIHFPVFQAPSAMGYFHQNPVSWPAAPTNGLIPFPHSNPYLYAGPLGYGLNEDHRFCLQYGALQQPTSLFNPGVPVYQPVASANVLNAEERTRVSKTASLPEHLNGSFAERVFPAGPISKKPASHGEVRHDNSAKSLENNNDFSLFHFGGPVALSTGCKSAFTSLNGDTVGDFSSKSSADHVEKVHNCNKKETPAMEEYNLFATSNNLRFSIF
ncbi:hypothetical protein AAZX31_19G135900 [Glycine max]|uniref:Uncharacterized protein n=2 Tax=Glycine subgen. Soja TaxID=1462606 RepID=I1N9B2_SOYBN|nr:uncharacterized protein LOC100813046 [Glycine max]XP_028217352.1 uncharacterized protein LOC114399363 [Glycine soja]KAG5083500.1 hypothetical protein JHK84_053538 [Glycine max]KAG5086271.1 hypothetical protein JHK82_053668 [Glycine max]KAH1077902.1 hypothetical protein GYH30_053109 [Glycine max]KRG95421.1 hypothetical protein GLYMA_19G149800v4 [Glycine max]RZB48027.1 hypothetical protein D0Y65_051530 [Glycine soja]|eukprot:XP_003553437.1 uncharacterized protein LOC100813046 isoform X1 [Glycine max]